MPVRSMCSIFKVFLSLKPSLIRSQELGGEQAFRKAESTGVETWCTTSSSRATLSTAGQTSCALSHLWLGPPLHDCFGCFGEASPLPLYRETQEERNAWGGRVKRLNNTTIARVTNIAAIFASASPPSRNGQDLRPNRSFPTDAVNWPIGCYRTPKENVSYLGTYDV